MAELRLTFLEVFRVMKRDAVGVVVFGQSPSRQDAQLQFVEDLQSMGFIIELERKRQIAIGRRQKPSLAQESILVIRK